MCGITEPIVISLTKNPRLPLRAVNRASTVTIGSGSNNKNSTKFSLRFIKSTTLSMLSFQRRVFKWACPILPAVRCGFRKSNALRLAVLVRRVGVLVRRRGRGKAGEN